MDDPLFDKRNTQQGLLLIVIAGRKRRIYLRNRLTAKPYVLQTRGIWIQGYLGPVHTTHPAFPHPGPILTSKHRGSQKMAFGTPDPAKATAMRFMWIEHMTFRFEIPKFDFSLTLSQLS